MQLDPDRRNVVVIGASAGGVEALSAIVSALPPTLRGAVLLVLHISPHAPSSLHAILQRSTRLKVRAAEDGMAIEQGTVYVAVADHHLSLDAGRIRLTRGPKECRVRPSIDVLFRSAAISYGPRVIGVVLTGALDDGTAGTWAVKDRGGLVFVQDPAEADYPSMPESAIEHVRTDFIGSLEALAALIAERCGELIAGLAQSAAPQAMAVETGVAQGADGLEDGVMELGKISRYTCPECHGVLVQIEEGPIVRFRCHTGHAFSIKTLMAELNIEIDRGLWDAIRVIEEKVMLTRTAAERAERMGHSAAADQLRSVLEATENSLEPLRDLAKSRTLFDNGE